MSLLENKFLAWSLNNSGQELNFVKNFVPKFENLKRIFRAEETFSLESLISLENPPSSPL